MFHHKFKSPDKVYFLGCSHLQHVNITRGPSKWPAGNMLRDFDTTEEMTEAVLKGIISVPEDAHLFLLGDFLFGVKKNMGDILSRIPCKNIYYLFGNHCDWLRPKAHEFSNKIKWFGDYLEVFYNNQMIILSHYAHAVWRDSHHGSWMICSHSHGSYEPALPTTLDRGKVLDVGWDVFKKPISISEVKTIMDKKQESFVDHHNRKTT